MIANSKLYFLIFLGLIPMLVVGILQVGYSIFNPGKFPLTGIEPLIVSLIVLYDIILLILFIIDVILTVRQDEIVITREVAEKLSINRYNPVKLSFSNFSTHELIGVIKDDYPDITSYQLTTENKYVKKHLI